MSRSNDGTRKPAQTRRGYAVPSGGADAEDGEGRRRARRARSNTPSAAPTEASPNTAKSAFVDVEVVRVGGPVSPFDGAWRAFEVWTTNRVYALDVTLHCIAVFDRSTGRQNATHSLIGAHLVGGQVRHGEHAEVWQPLPVPGSEAVFEQTKSGRAFLSYTSDVERIVVRLRGVSTSHDHLLQQVHQSARPSMEDGDADDVETPR